jgi:hypothetical protein
MALAPVRSLPKLSASQLADYLVAPTPIGQIGILRQAKNPSQSRPLVIQYQHARRCISAWLQEPASINRLAAAAITALQQRRDDPTSSPLVRDDAVRSISVIETFQRGVNALDLAGVHFEAPPTPSVSLTIAGVEVTVWPDAIARVTTRSGESRVGEVFIRCTIGPQSDGAENRRSEANGHLATIAHVHAATHMQHLGTPHSPTSMVIDVSRQTVVRGPANIARRVANIETACAMIAAIWPTV